MIIAVVSICILVIVLDRILNFYTRKFTTNIDIIEKLKEAIQEEDLTTVLNIKKGNKPSYDYMDNQINISEGKTTRHIAEAFHELGHAIDAKGTNIKYGPFSSLFYLILKYSLPISVVLYVVQTQLEMDVLIVPTYIFMAFGLWFVFGTLREEIVATKNALKVMDKHLSLTKQDKKVVNIALFNGMLSYLTLCILMLILTGSQIYYTFF